MRRFNVNFFKEILSSDGHPFKCLQRTLDVVAENEKRAVEQAKLKFEKETHVRWSCQADTCEVEEGAPKEEKIPRTDAPGFALHTHPIDAP
jgi:hypothetical protein